MSKYFQIRKFKQGQSVWNSKVYSEHEYNEAFTAAAYYAARSNCQQGLGIDPNSPLMVTYDGGHVTWQLWQYFPGSKHQPHKVGIVQTGPTNCGDESSPIRDTTTKRPTFTPPHPYAAKLPQILAAMPKCPESKTTRSIRMTVTEYVGDIVINESTNKLPLTETDVSGPKRTVFTQVYTPVMLPGDKSKAAMISDAPLNGVLCEIARERMEQTLNKKDENDDLNGPIDWFRFMNWRLVRSMQVAAGVRRGIFVQVAAMLVAAIQSIDRTTTPSNKGG